MLVRPPGVEPVADPSLVLLQEHGLNPLPVAPLRHVQNLEADDSFSGVLSNEAAAAAVGVAPRLVTTELKRLLEDGYLAATDQVEDAEGGFDLANPCLTTRSVAVLAIHV